jgi:hypothetical protein
MYERVLGPEHPDTLWARSNVANVLDEKGKYAEEEAQSRDVHERNVLGCSGPSTFSWCLILVCLGIKTSEQVSSSEGVCAPSCRRCAQSPGSGSSDDDE